MNPYWLHEPYQFKPNKVIYDDGNVRRVLHEDGVLVTSYLNLHGEWELSVRLARQSSLDYDPNFHIRRLGDSSPYLVFQRSYSPGDWFDSN